MKLVVTLSKRKDARGRIMAYRAEFGNWSAEGPTAVEAEEQLTALIERLATENGDPYVQFDASGDVWITRRSDWGTWEYGRFSTQGTQTVSCGVSIPANGTRKSVRESMQAHIASLYPAGAAIPTGTT